MPSYSSSLVGVWFSTLDDQLWFEITVIQLMMPSLRQIGDFFSAVYAPYGEDEVADNRYDYNYSEDYKPYMQQFRNVRITVGLLCRV